LPKSTAAFVARPTAAATAPAPAPTSAERERRPFEARQKFFTKTARALADNLAQFLERLALCANVLRALVGPARNLLPAAPP